MEFRISAGSRNPASGVKTRRTDHYTTETYAYFTLVFCFLRNL